MTILFGYVRIIYLLELHVNPYEQLQFGSYFCIYAWHMLISLSYRLKDRLTDAFVSKLVNLSLFYHSLRDLRKKCHDNRFLEIYIAPSSCVT